MDFGLFDVHIKSKGNKTFVKSLTHGMGMLSHPFKMFKQQACKSSI